MHLQSLLIALTMLAARNFGVAFSKVAPKATRWTLALRAGSTDVPEEMKPFYALGVNVALQVGDGLKPILSKSELDAMLKGFADSLTDKAGDPRELLQKYGPAINKMIQERSSNQADSEKKSGAEFATKYLLSNPKAVKTASGLIFNEIIAGIGKQVMHYYFIDFARCVIYGFYYVACRYLYCDRSLHWNLDRWIYF